MRKLYDLVKFRNDLESKLQNLDLTFSIEGVIEILNILKSSNKHDIYTSSLDEFVDDYKNLKTESKIILERIRNRIAELNFNIDKIAKELFDNDDFKNLMTEELICQKLNIDKNLESDIVSKITFYCDWHYPTLQINPREQKWIDYMVAGDPLYLTSHNPTDFKEKPEHLGVIKELIQGYPDLYQQRLRLYSIENRDYSVLPQNQFGFVLCWDNFNYLSHDKIEKYLKEIFGLLRPGGVLLFSYTNCDIDTMSFRAESRAAGYTTRRSIEAKVLEIGYEIIEFKDNPIDDAFTTHISWAELKKPGILKTVKAHQSMAQIISK